MIQGDPPDSDAPRGDAPLTVPLGVPLSVWEWLLPPMLIVVVVGLLACFIPIAPLKPYLITTASSVLVAAIVNGVFGFRAYMYWDEADVRWQAHTMTATMAAIAVFALPIGSGLASAGLLAAASSRLAAFPGRGVGRIRSALPARAWMRLKASALIVGLIAMIAHPLASAFGLGLIAWAMLIAAAVVFGFARRSLPAGYDSLQVAEGRTQAKA